MQLASHFEGTRNLSPCVQPPLDQQLLGHASTAQHQMSAPLPLHTSDTRLKEVLLPSERPSSSALVGSQGLKLEQQGSRTCDMKAVIKQCLMDPDFHGEFTIKIRQSNCILNIYGHDYEFSSTCPVLRRSSRQGGGSMERTGG